MSKAVKKVGKAFKKVVKAVWKVAKPIAIAVAAYFTAGVALSFIPATAGFAASLPGFAGGGIAGTGVGAGATAGTGIFSKVASTIGLGGGLAKGAFTGSSLWATPATMSEVASVYGPTKAAAASMATTAGSVGGGAGAGVSIAGGGGASGAMSMGDKLLLAKVGTDVATAAFGPSEADMMELEYQYAQKARQGTYYGMAPDGTTAQPQTDFDLFSRGSPPPPAEAPVQQEMVPTGDQSSTVQTPQTPMPGASPSPSMPGTNQGAGEDQTRIQAGRQKAGQLFQTPVSQQMPFEEDEDTGMPGLFGKGQMKQQYDVPEGIFAPAPGVRYV